MDLIQIGNWKLIRYSFGAAYEVRYLVTAQHGGVRGLRGLHTQNHLVQRIKTVDRVLSLHPYLARMR